MTGENAWNKAVEYLRALEPFGFRCSQKDAGYEGNDPEVLLSRQYADTSSYIHVCGQCSKSSCPQRPWAHSCGRTLRISDHPQSSKRIPGFDTANGDLRYGEHENNEKELQKFLESLSRLDAPRKPKTWKKRCADT